MENIELGQSKKKTWSTCIRTSLESNGWENVWYIDSNLLNIEQFKQQLTNRLNQHTQNTLFEDNVKMGTANKLHMYWANTYT